MDPDPETTMFSSLILFFLAYTLSTVLFSFLSLLGLALVRAREAVIEEMFAEVDKLRDFYVEILEKEDFYRTTIEVFRVCSCLALGVSFYLFFELLPQVLRALSLSGVVLWGVVVLCLLASVLFPAVLILTARSLALSWPERMVVWFGWALRFFSLLTRPLAVSTSRLHLTLVKLFGFRFVSERDAVVSSEELSELVRASAEAGEIEDDEGELLAGVFEFADTDVAAVMTPRKDVVSLSHEAALAEVLQAADDAGYSRLLVIGEDLDDVRGLLLVKDLLRYVGVEVTDFDLLSLCRKPMFVPGSMAIDELLQEFQREATHFAVVLDEHGGVDGVVTMEDLLEEITGDIFDEHDVPEEEAEIVQTKAGDFLVDGAMAVGDLNEEYELEFPESEEYDTFAGFLIHTLGRLPEEGESIVWEGVRITVESVDQHRITVVRIHAESTDFAELPESESEAA